MAAGFIASLTFLIIYLHQTDRQLGAWNWVLAGAMLGLSFLMISNIRYPSFKGVGWSTRASVPLLAIGTIFVGATIFYYWILPAVLFSAYLIYGLIRPMLSVQRRAAVEEVLDSQGDGDCDGDE
jgi:CDP-diacylglycerol--serine O-phosphatidyltransferase